MVNGNLGTIEKAPRRAKLAVPNYEPYAPEKLKELRISKRLSQSEMAEASGIPLNTIKKWEAGIKMPSKEGMGKLGKFFGVYFYSSWPESDEEE